MTRTITNSSDIDESAIAELVADIRNAYEDEDIDFDFANHALLWIDHVGAYGTAPTRRGLGCDDPRLSESLNRWGYRSRQKYGNPTYDYTCDPVRNPDVIAFYKTINSPDCDIEDATIETTLDAIDTHGTGHDDSLEGHLLDRLPMWEWRPSVGTPVDDETWMLRFTEAEEVCTRLGRLPTAGESRRVYDWLRGQQRRDNTPEQQALLLTLPGWAQRIGHAAA